MPEAILAGLLSEEIDRAWAAAGEVMALAEGPELAALAAALNRIEGALHAAGGPPAKQQMLALAMRRLQLYQARLVDGATVENCFCQLLPTALFLSPTPLETKGFIILTSARSDPEKDVTYHKGTCLDCGTRWFCTEHQSGHAPVYEWQPAL